MLRKGSVAQTPARTPVSLTMGRISAACGSVSLLSAREVMGYAGAMRTISTTTWLASPYGIRPASEPRPAMRKRPELYMMMRSAPPASTDLAERPTPRYWSVVDSLYGISDVEK